jgi:hypothetical protein
MASVEATEVTTIPTKKGQKSLIFTFPHPIFMELRWDDIVAIIGEDMLMTSWRPQPPLVVINITTITTITSIINLPTVTTAGMLPPFQMLVPCRPRRPPEIFLMLLQD